MADVIITNIYIYTITCNNPTMMMSMLFTTKIMHLLNNIKNIMPLTSNQAVVGPSHYDVPEHILRPICP